MSKLQEIKRPNGTKVHFTYIPEDLLNKLEWLKGDELHFDISEKDGRSFLTVWRMK